MSLKPLEEQMIRKMLKEIDYYETNIEFIGDDVMDAEKAEIVKKEYNKLVDDVDDHGDMLAANPEYFDILECWVVCICGTGGANIPFTGGYIEMDIEDFIGKFGNLAYSVKNFIENKYYDIVEINGRDNLWFMNVICNEPDSRKLCFYLYDEFQQAIKLKLLNVYKKFAGHRLPGLRSTDEVLEWAKDNNFII